MFPITTTGLLVLEYEGTNDQTKVSEALTKAIEETKFKGFWNF